MTPPPEHRLGAITPAVLRDCRALVVQIDDLSIRVPVEEWDTPETFLDRLVEAWNPLSRHPRLKRVGRSFWLVRRHRFARSVTILARRERRPDLVQ